MEEKINKILDMIIKGVEKGSEIASEQAGPLFEEYWKYLLADKIIGIIAGLLFLVLAYICYRVAVYSWKRYKIEQEKTGWADEWLWGVVTSVILACIFTLMGTIEIICKSSNLVKLIVAPKIYVIKAIKEDIAGEKE